MLQIQRECQAKDSGLKPNCVPLRFVRVDATLRSFAADVTITQVFRNNEPTPIEAVYCFPIEEQAAVYAFVARIDDREIIGQLQEKKQAQKEYDDALRKGHGAYLLEQDEKSLDNFIINVGALLPEAECHITLSYVSELDLVENGSKIRFVVPTTIAPRYNPSQGGISSPAGTCSNYVALSPYTIEFRCRVEKLGVSRVSSTSHPIQVDLNQQDVYVIEFAKENTHLDRDILVDIELVEQRSNTIVAVEPGAVMVSLTPTEEDWQRIVNDLGITKEYIFIVDCSGSMNSENKIGLARQAMILFLKSLPVGCHFNIIRFGSDHQSLFQNITNIYDEANVKVCQDFINQMKADLGGTELLSPLQWVNDRPPSRGCSRQIFLLTDGEITNVDEVLDLCRSMSTSTRIFSFGLGHSPSRSLVKGVARATNGRFVFIPPNISVDVYVGEQFRKALQPCITNAHVKWNLNAPVMSCVPANLPPVYMNDRLIIYALLENKCTSFDHQATVELYVDQYRLGEAHVNRIPSVAIDGTIARLAAKALILELQHSKLKTKTNKEIQQGIIELSLKHNILSPHTAFVGIEKRINASNADMVLREVPIQVSVDDQHLNLQYATPIAQMRHQAHQQHHHDKMRCHEALQRYHAAQQHNHQAHDNYLHCLERHEDAERRLRDVRRRLYDAQRFRLEAEQFYRDTREDQYGALIPYDETLRRRDEAEKRIEEAERRLDDCEKEVANSAKNEHVTRAELQHCDHKQQETGNILHQSGLELQCAENESYRNQRSIGQEIDKITKQYYCSREYPASDSKTTTILDVNLADQDAVRQLINKQNFDGIWNMDSKSIEALIGKPLKDFPDAGSIEVLITAIVIIVLETRFASLSSMWHAAVQKARKRLAELLDQQKTTVDALLESIRKKL